MAVCTPLKNARSDFGPAADLVIQRVVDLAPRQSGHICRKSATNRRVQRADLIVIVVDHMILNAPARIYAVEQARSCAGDRRILRTHDALEPGIRIHSCLHAGRQTRRATQVGSLNGVAGRARQSRAGYEAVLRGTLERAELVAPRA